MSLQTIEIALPSDLIEQIDAEVGPDHRSEFLTQVASEAVSRKRAPKRAQDSPQSDHAGIPQTSRFKPVPIKGEPASVTLLRDRGSY